MNSAISSRQFSFNHFILSALHHTFIALKHVTDDFCLPKASFDNRKICDEEDIKGQACCKGELQVDANPVRRCEELLVLEDEHGARDADKHLKESTVDQVQRAVRHLFHRERFFCALAAAAAAEN